MRRAGSDSLLPVKTILAFLLALALPNFAAELEPIIQSHIGLAVALSSTSAKAEDHFKSGYGSSDVHTEKERGITGEVRNYGREMQRAVIKTIWICRHTGVNDRFVFCTETELAEIKAGATWRFLSWSGPVTGSDLKLVMIGTRYTEGSRLEGWVVTVHDPDANLIGIHGSDTHLEEWARTPGNVPEVRKEIINYKAGRHDPTGYLAFGTGGRMFHVLSDTPDTSGKIRRAMFTIWGTRFEWAPPIRGFAQTVPEYGLPEAVK